MTDQLREFVENNPKLVTRRESIRHPGLFVIKYTRKVFYDALWNDVLEECRGLVVDAEWNRVVNPFRKIYNRGERGTDFPLDEPVVAVQKVNGFMAAVTYVKDHGVVVSTTGSLDSPFVDLAEDNLVITNALNFIGKAGHRITWLFEICDERDPHIIPEAPGAYLIGARMSDGTMMSEGALDSFAGLINVNRPAAWTSCPFESVLLAMKNCRHEGFVVHSHRLQKSLKIKSAYYLVTKFLARMRSDKFLERINDPKLKETIDEEYYPLLDHVRDNQISFSLLNDEQAKIAVIRNFLERVNG
jgi:RNA ligase